MIDQVAAADELACSGYVKLRTWAPDGTCGERQGDYAASRLEDWPWSGLWGFAARQTTVGPPKTPVDLEPASSMGPTASCHWPLRYRRRGAAAPLPCAQLRRPRAAGASAILPDAPCSWRGHSRASAELTLPLQEKIRTAKRRLFIASLYIGKEEKELVSPCLEYASVSLNQYAENRSRRCMPHLRRIRPSDSPSSSTTYARLASIRRSPLPPLCSLLCGQRSLTKSTSGSSTLPSSLAGRSTSSRDALTKDGVFSI